METKTEETDIENTDLLKNVEENDGVASDLPVFRVTDGAFDRVIAARDNEPDPELLALRIEVTGIRGSEYTYDVAFHTSEDREENDLLTLQTLNGHALQIIVPAKSIENLRGAELDIDERVSQGGLVIRNPNRPNPMDGASLTLTGTVAEQIQQLLTYQINPSLASHGGFVELVGVDDTKVYLSMGGGCQGCAMSQATMVQGVERSILDAIEGVTEVIDVTDHASGASPFYN